MKKKWIIIVVILLVAAGYGYKKFFSDQGTQAAVDDTPSDNLPPLARASDNFEVFGTLVIYDPSVPDSPLKDHSFVPGVWYLIPQGVDEKKGMDSPALDYQISLDDNTVCTALSNQSTRWLCNSKAQVIPWGYGEKVKISGFKNNRLINASSMTLVNY